MISNAMYTITTKICPNKQANSPIAVQLTLSKVQERYFFVIQASYFEPIFVVHDVYFIQVHCIFQRSVFKERFYHCWCYFKAIKMQPVRD